METKMFGMIGDTPIMSYTLKNKNGMSVELLSYGAAIRCLRVPDQSGSVADISLGYDSLEEYIHDSSHYFGATIGRVANRIAGAQFVLNAKRYLLYKNNNENCLHGGKVGFDSRVWLGEECENGVAFTRFSPDGEEGFPGGLNVTVRYTLSDDNTLALDYLACTDADTVLNLTNHNYFNLAGHDSGVVYDQELFIDAQFYMPGTPDCLPTGEVLLTRGTPFDFTAMKPIGRDMRSGEAQIAQYGGYDHNFVLASGDAPYRPVAKAHDPKSGRSMVVMTDLPGLQLYTGNGVNAIGKGGTKYEKNSAFCLETQYFPNALHHGHFEGYVLKAGTVLKSTTAYRFTG